MKIKMFYVLFFSLLITIAEWASSSTTPIRNHGLATLTLAVEDDVLNIQFDTAAANLLDVADEAGAPTEKKAFRKAKKMLKTPKSLFSFTGTQCKVKKIKVSKVAINDDNSTKEYSDHARAHGDRADHTHTHFSLHEQGRSHQKKTAQQTISPHDQHKISVQYNFKCNNGQSLSDIEVAIFDRFPGVEVINVSWMTKASSKNQTSWAAEVKQGSTRLISKVNNISLR